MILLTACTFVLPFGSSSCLVLGCLSETALQVHSLIYCTLSPCPPVSVFTIHPPFTLFSVTVWTHPPREPSCAAGCLGLSQSVPIGRLPQWRQAQMPQMLPPESGWFWWTHLVALSASVPRDCHPLPEDVVPTVTDPHPRPGNSGQSRSSLL